MPEEKNTIPRGPAATRAKNKYRESNYDRMELTIPKGGKERIQGIAKKAGYNSCNAYILAAIEEKIEREKEA